MDSTSEQPEAQKSTPAALHETRSVRFRIVEDLAESGDKKRLAIIEGPFMTLGEENDNHREYPDHVTPGLLAINESLRAEGSRPMLLDHPTNASGQGSLKDLAAGLSEVRVDGREASFRCVVPNSRHGQDLLSWVESGIRIPVSLRGSGTLVRESRGDRTVSVVQPDFRLETIDFVTTPGFRNAAAKHLHESRQRAGGERPMELDPDDLKTADPEVYAKFQEHFSKDLESSFKAKLRESVVDAVERARKDIREQERAKALAEYQTPVDRDQRVGKTGNGYLPTPAAIRSLIAQLGYPTEPFVGMSDDELTSNFSNLIGGFLSGRKTGMEPEGPIEPSAEGPIQPVESQHSEMLKAILEGHKRILARQDALERTQEDQRLTEWLDDQIETKPAAMAAELRLAFRETQADSISRLKSVKETEAWLKKTQGLIERLSKAIPQQLPVAGNVFLESVHATPDSARPLSPDGERALHHVGLDDYIATQGKN